MTSSNALLTSVLQVCSDVIAEFEGMRDTAADPQLRHFYDGMHFGALALAGRIGALNHRESSDDDAQEPEC